MYSEEYFRQSSDFDHIYVCMYIIGAHVICGMRLKTNAQMGLQALNIDPRS